MFLSSQSITRRMQEFQKLKAGAQKLLVTNSILSKSFRNPTLVVSTFERHFVICYGLDGIILASHRLKHLAGDHRRPKPQRMRQNRTPTEEPTISLHLCLNDTSNESMMSGAYQAMISARMFPKALAVSHASMSGSKVSWRRSGLSRSQAALGEAAVRCSEIRTGRSKAPGSTLPVASGAASFGHSNKLCQNLNILNSATSAKQSESQTSNLFRESRHETMSYVKPVHIVRPAHLPINLSAR